MLSTMSSNECRLSTECLPDLRELEAGVHPGEHGQHEGGGLACARLRLGDHVLGRVRQQGRQGSLLGKGDSGVGELG